MVKVCDSYAVIEKARHQVSQHLFAGRPAVSNFGVSATNFFIFLLLKTNVSIYFLVNFNLIVEFEFIRTNGQ